MLEIVRCSDSRQDVLDLIESNGWIGACMGQHSIRELMSEEIPCHTGGALSRTQD